MKTVFMVFFAVIKNKSIANYGVFRLPASRAGNSSLRAVLYARLAMTI
ncbi:MAG: hypothetical protein IKH45_01270 [Neisseriaceae bacterium]|nr:hypothetical protein [Neisseriaceae bacterium]